MSELLQANWILLVVALMIGVVVAWWVFAASRRTKVEIEDKGEGETAARRNQALIDAPPAAAKDAMPPPTPEAIGGAGVAVGAAAQADEAERKSQIAETSPGALSADANTEEVAAAPGSTDAEAGPSPAPAPAPADAPADDLTQIKGVGPKLAAQLRDLGVTSYARIAAWDDAEIDRIDARLGRFQGRIRRDDWVTQAGLLASGDTAAYEARFGKM